MMWLFAVIAVLVMGAAAVVALGRGGSMAEVYDDRPDSRVPADGPLTEEPTSRQPLVDQDAGDGGVGPSEATSLDHAHANGVQEVVADDAAFRTLRLSRQIW